MIDELPDGNYLLHGDFHLCNIIVNKSKQFVINFSHLCKGPVLADIAQTYYLISSGLYYESVSLPAEKKEILNNQRIALANSYLSAMKYIFSDIKNYIQVYERLNKPNF